MSELSGKYIGDAFAKIRAEFEERNNTTGLEMLDGLEEQCAVSESLSECQIGWLEKQLDGSWLSREKLSAKSAGNHSPRPKREYVAVRFSIAPILQARGDAWSVKIGRTVARSTGCSACGAKKTGCRR